MRKKKKKRKRYQRGNKTEQVDRKSRKRDDVVMCLAGCDWLSRGEAVGCLQPIKTQALRSCYGGRIGVESIEYGTESTYSVVDGGDRYESCYGRGECVG